MPLTINVEASSMLPPEDYASSASSINRTRSRSVLVLALHILKVATVLSVYQNSSAVLSIILQPVQPSHELLRHLKLR